MKKATTTQLLLVAIITGLVVFGVHLAIRSGAANHKAAVKLMSQCGGVHHFSVDPDVFTPHYKGACANQVITKRDDSNDT
jgi:hypothetical protein